MGRDTVMAVGLNFGMWVGCAKDEAVHGLSLGWGGGV